MRSSAAARRGSPSSTTLRSVSSWCCPATTSRSARTRTRAARRMGPRGRRASPPGRPPRGPVMSEPMVAVRHGWGERLHAVLDRTGAAAARGVQRGRALARRGAVEEVVLGSGTISGRVLEDRAAPVEVVISWPVGDDAAWKRATELLARRLRPIAALLEDELTPTLSDELAAAGIDLIPAVGELAPRC